MPQICIDQLYSHIIFSYFRKKNQHGFLTAVLPITKLFSSDLKFKHCFFFQKFKVRSVSDMYAFNILVLVILIDRKL